MSAEVLSVTIFTASTLAEGFRSPGIPVTLEREREREIERDVSNFERSGMCIVTFSDL